VHLLKQTLSFFACCPVLQCITVMDFATGVATQLMPCSTSAQGDYLRQEWGVEVITFPPPAPPRPPPGPPTPT
jgi:hypothetical protein